MTSQPASLVTALLALAAAPAAAAGPDAARGLIAEHYTACHEVPGYEARFERADLGAPSFQAIADGPVTHTEAPLTAFLRQPHYPMAGFILSASDIENIIAFIQGLHGK